MECVTVINDETAPRTEEEPKLNSDSAENFQHFIYELFEKNGILNDLRAYLRGHIVEVLKSAQTGVPPTCQKHFTQRLELANQALNMLVAEYLLRYEFSYSLSVFISEIPLSNMVFGLAKTLMKQSDNGDHSKLWFSESDVWSVLNYLGIKCDSVHATNIIEKYRTKNSPLLLCILKSLPFYCRQDIGPEEDNSSIVSVTSEKSRESLPEKYSKHQKSKRHEKCKHYTHCKACQSRLHCVKEKYAKKKKNLKQNINILPENTDGEDLVKNITFTEKALVDEMFYQLKNVYDTEVEMLKVEEENKYKQVLATYAVQLQRRQSEMEEKFKQREKDLESAVQQKKKFLWGLAQALREQHHNMAAAMNCVRGQSQRLLHQEDNLKTHLVEAENMIKSRGEEMRAQISNEIIVMEEHLESMKKERDSIDKEKSELEKFKTLCDSKVKLIDDDSKLEDLRKELVALKKYIEGRKMCVVEKCTMTDFESGGRMNNEELGGKSDSEEKLGRTPNQVVNDLKKQKNVNFNQSRLDVLYEESRRDHIRPNSSSRFEERDVRRDAILVLQDENDRLKHFARQQEQHIDELNIQTARLQAELESSRVRRDRPRTAPTLTSNYEYYEPRVNSSISATYNRFAGSLGAGEHSLFDARALVRNDTTRDRRDSRRYLIQQWRALRRTSPSFRPHTRMAPAARAPSASHSVDAEPIRETAGESNYCIERADQDENAVQPMPEVASDGSPRCKSPNSMLKEAKQRLRNKVRDVPKNHLHTKREKSPNSVLREAKLRLRKLEIEAEAVERSYLDFRNRQAMRQDRFDYVCNDVKLDAKQKQSFNEISRQEITCNETANNLQKCKRDLDKFLNKYEKKFKKTESHIRNKSPNDRARVIPESYVEIDRNNVARKDNSYLETPLVEFRKFYSQKPLPSKLEQTKQKHTIEAKNNDKPQTENKDDVIKTKNQARKEPKEKELQILKENIKQIYNLKEPTEDNVEVKNEKSQGDKNLLRIEIESVAETNNLQLKECESQDVLVVVQSPAETRNISNSDFDEELPPQMTVIVSPKVRNNKDETEIQSQDQSSNIPVRLEKPEKLSEDTMFHIENDVVTAPVVQQGGSQYILDSLSDRDKADDYIDDFSADVDNYNSRSDYEDNSPISHIKTSEDENFWDS